MRVGEREMEGDGGRETERERERGRESGGPFQQIFASLVLKLEEDTFLKWAIPSLFFFIFV